MPQAGEWARSGPQTAGLQRREGSRGERHNRRQNGQPGGHSDMPENRRQVRRAQTDSKGRKDAVFPPINLQAVPSVPPVPVGAVSQTPRVTAGLSFKDVLTSRLGTARGPPAVLRSITSEQRHQEMSPKSARAPSGSNTVTSIHPAPPVRHSRPDRPSNTPGEDQGGVSMSISSAISHLATEARAVEDGGDLLGLSQAVRYSCQLLQMPKMIIDMLEVHQQHLKSRSNRRTELSTLAPLNSSSSRLSKDQHPTVSSPPEPAPTNVDTVAILSRIRDKLSLCDGLLTENI